MLIQSNTLNSFCLNEEIGTFDQAKCQAVLRFDMGDNKRNKTKPSLSLLWPQRFGLSVVPAGFGAW